LLIGVGKKFTNITKARSAQKSVRQGVENDIRIGMAG
jgi:hypothetical protein